MTRSGSDQAAWPPSVRRRQDEIDAASPVGSSSTEMVARLKHIQTIG